MSSPFNAGRDSSAGPSSDMFCDPVPGDLSAGAGVEAQVAAGFSWTHDNLSEKDYRDPENKP
jgi:hypothetical protein